MTVAASTKCCGEPAGALVGAGAAAPLERLADLAVQAHAARRRELVEQRLLHQRVREAVAARLAHLLDHARLERLLDQSQQLVLVALAEQRERLVRELAADDGGDLQQLVRLLGEAVEAPAERLAHAVRDGDVRARSRR